MKQLLVSLGRGAAASAVMICLAAPLSAGITGIFVDRAAWDTAVLDGSLTAVQTADFEGSLSSGSAPNAYQSYSTSAGYTSSIFTFLGYDILGGQGQTYSLYRVQDGTSNVWLQGPPKYNGPGQDQNLTINLANNANAFALDIASSVDGISFQITFTNGTGGTDTVATQLAPTTTFWGVSTDAPILQVSIRMLAAPTDARSRIDNVSAGFFTNTIDPPPSDTPEPSTSIAVVTGIAALAWTRRRLAAQSN